MRCRRSSSFIPKVRSAFAWAFVSGKELQESLLKGDWGGRGVEQCHSLVDSCLYRVRIKLFTSVPSANARPGQLHLLQCLDRNFAVSPNQTCASWWLLNLQKSVACGKLSCRSFPTACWQSTAFTGVGQGRGFLLKGPPGASPKGHSPLVPLQVPWEQPAPTPVGSALCPGCCTLNNWS